MTVLRRAPLFPRSPSGPGSAAGSEYVEWLNLVDRDGGLIAKYHLTLHPAHSLTSQFSAVIADYGYQLFLVVSAHGAALLSFLLNPDAWLEPLSQLYGTVTAKVYGVLPPTALAILAFSYLAVKIFLQRGKAGPAAQVSKAQWDQVHAGVLLLAVVAVLATNPFRLISEALKFVLDLASWVSLSSDAGVGSRVNESIVNTIRELTFLINYHGSLGADCAKIWAKTMNVGGTNPDCLTPAQMAGTKADPVTALNTALAIVYGLALLYFAVVIFLHIFNQLGLCIFYLTGAVYAAVAGMNHRRALDPLSRCLSRAAGHGLLTLLFWGIAGAGPGLLIGLASSVLVFLPVWLQIALMAGAYRYSAKILRGILDKQETLFDLFRQRVEKSKHWAAIYANNNQTTVLGHTLDGALEHPKQWVADRYKSATGRWAAFKESAQDGPSKESAMSSPAIIPDSPELSAALHRVDTHHPDEAERQPQEVTGSDIAAAPALGQVIDHGAAGNVAAEKVVAITPRGALVGRPAGLTDLIAPSGGEQSGDAAQPIYFRGGLPQLVPPIEPLVIDLPTAAGGPQQHSQIVLGPGELATEKFGNTMAGYWNEVQARNAQVRSQAAALAGHAPSVGDQIASATATFTSGDATEIPVATRVAAKRIQRLPELRSILDSAARTQRFKHNVNLLRARGISAPVRICDEDEAAEQLVFVTDPDGRNRVKRRNDAGFGDVV